MAEFLTQIFQSPISFEQKLELIRDHRNAKALYDKDNKYHEIYQSQINILLSTSVKRIQGFQLIDEYLQEMPKDLLGDNLRNWATSCVSYIEGSTWNQKEIALELLNKLLKLGHHDDNTRRKLSLTVISPLVDHICRNNTLVKRCCPSSVFSVLLTCVSKYPGSCGSKKSLIQNFVLSNTQNFENTGFDVLTSIFANLHYCPTPGQSNSSANNSWFEHFSTLLVNCNSILNRLKSWGINFSDLNFTNKNIVLYLKPDESESLNGILKMKSNFHFLSRVICKMLQDSAALGLPISVSSILNLIGRACFVELVPLYKKDPSLSLALLSIQLDCLKILKQLIVTCKTALAPHSKVIRSILIRVLDNSLAKDGNNSNETPTSSFRSFFQLKDICYKVIAKFFSIVGPNMYIDRISADSLLKHFMIDMKPSEKYIELRNIKKDKNSKKSLDNIVSTPIVHDELISLHKHCIQAANLFVKSCLIHLSSEQVHFFSVFLIEEALSVYRYSIDVSYFYADPITRRELISLIVTLCQEGEVIPFNVALVILKKVLAVDSSCVMKNFCLDSLRNLNATINPTRRVRIIEVHYDAGDLTELSTTGETGGDDIEMTNQEARRANEQETTKRKKDQTDEGNSNEQSNKESRQTNGHITDNYKVTYADSDVQDIPSIVDDDVIIQEVSVDGYKKVKDANDEEINETDICIVYDPSECGDDDDIDIDIDSSKMSGKADIETVSLKSDRSSKSDDIEITGEAPFKRPKIVIEDSSSHQSLTVIEQADVEELEDDDIIKYFVPS